MKVRNRSAMVRWLWRGTIQDESYRGDRESLGNEVVNDDRAIGTLGCIVAIRELGSVEA